MLYTTRSRTIIFSLNVVCRLICYQTAHSRGTWYELKQWNESYNTTFTFYFLRIYTITYSSIFGSTETTSQKTFKTACQISRDKKIIGNIDVIKKRKIDRVSVSVA